MDKIGIKVIGNSKIAKCISSIRKYTNLSIGEVKDKIINNDYVIVCGYTDEDGIKNILKAYEEIKRLGVNVEIYEHDRITTIDFIMNLTEMYDNIAKDMQEMDDLMDDED